MNEINQGKSLATNISSNRSRRLHAFLSRQVQEIRRGGFSVLIRKAVESLLIVIFVPVVLIIRILRPIVTIRFGPLISERIGHFAINTELYLCRRDAGMEKQRAIDVFYTAPFICNQQLKKMWKRVLHICCLVGLLHKANHWIPGGGKHIVTVLFRGGERDIHGLMAKSRPHLSFTPDEESRGMEALRQLGIPNNSCYICFSARDDAYLEAVTPQKDSRYLDYRDSNISNYIAAMEEMANRDYYTIRMGAVVRKPIVSTNPRIIDYATMCRSDFLDIFLTAKCSFFLGDTAGICCLPMIFRRPIAFVNFIPLEYAPSWSPDYLFIPKKLWLQEEHRFLSFREMIDATAGKFAVTEDYEKLGIDVIENTPEEITALAIEMDERLNNRWQTTEEDKELQQRFWSLYKPNELHGVLLSRIGAEFLRQNKTLLE